MSATSDKMSGKAKQASGKVSGDRKMQAEGKMEELKGEAKNVINDMKDRFSGNRNK